MIPQELEDEEQEFWIDLRYTFSREVIAKTYEEAVDIAKDELEDDLFRRLITVDKFDLVEEDE